AAAHDENVRFESGHATREYRNELRARTDPADLLASAVHLARGLAPGGCLSQQGQSLPPSNAGTDPGGVCPNNRVRCLPRLMGQSPFQSLPPSNAGTDPEGVCPNN